MPQTISGLSTKEAEFLAKLASQGKEIITSLEAQAFWESPSATDKALYRLERRGWLHRLEQGVYLLVPLEAGPERHWSGSALVIAPYLVKPSAIAYWSALHYWQLTEQIPSTTFIQSTTRKRPARKTILNMNFRFVTVNPDKFFGLVRRTLNGQPFQVTDREKTLVDAADRPELSGGVYQLAQSLQMTQDIDWQRLSNYLQRWPTTNSTKRIGYLVEALGLNIPDYSGLLAQWQEQIAPGVVFLEPGQAQDTGRIITRWQLQINTTGPWDR
jgi:predicted transcriptional regulator of viral defense system